MTAPEVVSLVLSSTAAVISALSVREVQRGRRALKRLNDAHARLDAIRERELERGDLRTRAATFDRQAIAGMQERARREGRKP